MNDLSVQEIRKKHNLTQEELAFLLGSSRKTIVNYESGKTIPATKRELLLNIEATETEILRGRLKKKKGNTDEEPATAYEKTTGFDTKIDELKEKITQREEIILITSDEAKIKHHQDMIKLYKEQINLIQDAKKNNNLDK